MAKATLESRMRIENVTLNRPKSMNAVDLGMHEELWQIWEEFRQRDDVDVAIVTGKIRKFDLRKQFAWHLSSTERLTEAPAKPSAATTGSAT